MATTRSDGRRRQQVALFTEFFYRVFVVVVVVVVVVVGLVVGSFRSTLTNEYGRQSANIFDLVSIVQLSRIGLLILHLFKMSPKSPKNLPTINELPHNVCYTSTRTTFE